MAIIKGETDMNNADEFIIENESVKKTDVIKEITIQKVYLLGD